MNEKKQEIVDCRKCVHYMKLECLDCDRANMFEQRIINKQICNFCTHEEVCCDPEKYCCDVCKHYEEQRPHGTWVDVPKYKGFYVCSKCLERLDGDFERFDHWEMKKDNFCSVCGSDNRNMGDKE